MSRLYGPVHRSLQDRFDTRRLADNVESRVVLTEIPREHKAFIESRDCPFLFAFRCRGARSEHFCTDSWFQLGKGSAASKTPIRCRLSRRPS
jgi:hypothetical protein